MSSVARLAVRLMDRTRRIDEFEMATMAYDPALLVLEASLIASRLAVEVDGAPADEILARAVVDITYEQMFDDGFSVRTRLLEDGWLLLVRIDQRTGPAVVHQQTPETLLLAA